MQDYVVFYPKGGTVRDAMAVPKGHYNMRPEGYNRHYTFLTTFFAVDNADAIETLDRVVATHLRDREKPCGWNWDMICLMAALLLFWVVAGYVLGLWFNPHPAIP